jgi:hypothetical protein
MADATLDILGRRPQVIGQAYSSDAFQIVIAGQDQSFMLVQNLNFNYAQNVTRLFDLENADFQAYVASRPQGQMTLSNVVTDLDNLITFLQKYGDPCTAAEGKNITIEIQGRENEQGICQKQGGSISFSQPVLISTAMSIAVADYIVNNNMALIFASAASGGRTSGTT